MLPNLEPFEVTSISGKTTFATGEVVDGKPVEKIANVTVSEQDISCSLPMSADGASIHISISRTSTRSNMSFNNIAEIQDVMPIVELLKARMEDILTAIV